MKKSITQTQAKWIFDNRIKPRIIFHPNECWTLTSKSKNNGNRYACITVRPLNIRMSCHTITFIAFNGQPPTGHFILHKCDNPPCCNPEHLFSGTQADNLRDMDIKNRRGVWHPTGNKNPSKQLVVRKKLSNAALQRERDYHGQFAPKHKVVSANEQVAEIKTAKDGI